MNRSKEINCQYFERNGMVFSHMHIIGKLLKLL